MKGARWQRATVVLGAATWSIAVSLEACQSGKGASSVGPVEAGADAGVAEDAPPPDAIGELSPTDTDGESVPPASLPRVYVVNASPDAPPLRFCLGLGPQNDGGSVLVGGGLPATPQLPGAPFPLAGVYPGRGAPLQDQGIELDTPVQLFALDATNPRVVASTEADGSFVPCEGLIGTDGLGSTTDGGGVLRPGRDFWWLGTLPMAAPDPAATTLVAVVGCLPDDADAAAVCPAGYEPSKGDLHLLAWPLDGTTKVPAGSIGAQFAQASSEWEAVRAAVPGARTVAGFRSSGTLGTVAPDAGFGTLSPAKLAPISGVPLDGSASFGASVVAPDGSAVPPTPFAWTLPSIEAVTWPNGVPEGGAFALGEGYVFVLVGNPAASVLYVDPLDGGPSAQEAGGVVNGHYPHFLAFPVALP